MGGGVQVEDLRRDAAVVIQEVLRLGEKRMGEIDFALLKPVSWEQSSRKQKHARTERQTKYICDRCGTEMNERNCKITCPNCGNRFDCSDLNIYFD